MPKYLVTAGWSAAEAGLMGKDYPETERLRLIDGAIDCWQRAIRAQQIINARGNLLAEYSQPLRFGLDIAVTPLFRGIIMGNVSKDMCRDAFEGCLNVAKQNCELRNAAKQAGKITAMQDYAGFGYECNWLLAMNRHLSSAKFAIPAPARSDSGQYLPQQTHDLLAVQQEWGSIKRAVPIEVKGKIKNSDRKRYKALLIRGRLSFDQLSPDETLDTIVEAYQNPRNKKAVRAADSFTRHIQGLVQAYAAGEKLDITTEISVTSFRDNREVFARYPGLAPTVLMAAGIAPA